MRSAFARHAAIIGIAAGTLTSFAEIGRAHV